MLHALNNQATGIDWIRRKIVRILCDAKNSKELEPCQGEQKQNFTSSQRDGVQTKVFPHEKLDIHDVKNSEYF
jgi:hypothetical protein